MFRHLAVFSLCLMLLIACGATPTAEVPTQAIAPRATVSSDSTITAPTAVTQQSTEAPAEAGTEVATPVATKATELATPVQKGYGNLVLIKGIAVMLDDSAHQVETGQLKGFESLGRLLAIGTLYKAVDENIAKDAPDPALQAAWEQARIILPKLRDVVAQWSNKKITAADVPGLTAPIEADIDQMLTTAESDLSSAYGADPAKLKELRDKAITDLQTKLSATPTPKP